MDFEEKTLKRTEIFDGHVFKVVVDDIELPNNLGQAKRELVFHRGAVAVLAVTDDDKIILVKQYRKAIEKVSYEIPAGKLEIGENGSEREAAARELEEETGYSGDLKQIHEFYTAIGFCNEKIKLYQATHLQIHLSNCKLSTTHSLHQSIFQWIILHHLLAIQQSHIKQ